jgi:hypothetical protein
MAAEEVNLVSCTPLLGRRNLPQEADKVPQSPFLGTNNFKKDVTPMMQVRVRPNGDSDQMKIGGIVINRPNAAG